MSVAVTSPELLLEQETTRKIRWHVIPFMLAGFIICFLDRINISFAALQMNTDLKLSPAAFGFAAGVFFLGYFLFQVPSNLMMAKVGPRRWLGPLMLAWGVIAMSTAFVHTRTGLSIVRFLLGVAEAGFFPGLTLYITFWFRSRDHAKAIAWVLTGSYIAGFVGGPLSGWLLGWSHWGLRGWQWLFVIEGLLPVIFAFVILAFWTDRPQDAKWLRPEQREWIIREIAAEKATKDTPQKIGIRQALTRPGTLLLMFVFFVHSIGNLGVVFWMPQMLKSVGKTLTPMGVGLLTMLPNITFVFALLLCSWHSDKTGERHWHVVGAMLIGSLGLYLFPFTTMLPLAVLAICVAVFGMGGAHANFWASCIELLGPKEAAAGLALISSGSALGGFTGPYVAGLVKGMTGTYLAPMMVLASGPLIAGIIMHIFFVRTRLGIRQPHHAAGG